MWRFFVWVSMASRLVETIERDGKTINIYENGLEQDASNGHIIKPPPHVLIDSSEKSIALHRARAEEKQRRVMLGAAKHLQKTKHLDALPTDMDVVEAVSESVAKRAMDSDYKNQKQIEAARWIMSESGLATDPEQAPANETGVTRLFLLVAQLHERKTDVIDGQVTETDITVTDNDAHSSKDEG